jgi:uncharacterized membrane protein
MSDTRYSDRSDVTLGHVAYALYAAGFVTIIAFVASAILCLVKRDEVRGTILETHFTWIIRTFLWGLIASCVATVLAITIIGIPLAWLIWVCVYVWSIYRVVVGWLKLSEGRPIRDPSAWF